MTEKVFRIALLPGDGIGPEVCDGAVAVLEAAAAAEPDLSFQTETFSVGAGEFLKSGNPLPEETFQALNDCDAILLGAMGLPDVRWPDGTEMAPQLDIRERMDLFAGLRPIRLYQPRHSPLKGYEAGDIDFLLLRENTEGLFWSRKQKFEQSADEVIDSLRISRRGAERLFHEAFRQARRRKGRVTLIDKANVLPSMAYFRGIFEEIGSGYADVKRDVCYVDAAALYLVQRPDQYDVFVTENMFGDILSDLAAGIVGGMGMAPSADIGPRHAVFQPSHGSAPDIAGQGKANPTATILSAAMMLEWLDTTATLAGARRIYAAVEQVFADERVATADLGGTMSTSELAARIAEATRA